MKNNMLSIIMIPVLALGILFCGSLYAENPQTEVPPVFNEGDKVVNLGLGIGTTLYTGRYYTSRVPPVSVSFEMGFMDDFLVEDLTLGLGGYLGYASSKYEYGFGTWGWDYTYIIVGGRGAAHYPIIEDLDTYVGLMMGINITTSRSFGEGSSGFSADGSGIAYSLYGGARYYFAENLAVFGELGYGISYLTVGLALRF
jgi:hypothetical protein